jgi:hypothetical protein
MDTGTELQVECGVYFENFVMIGLTVDAGDNFKKSGANTTHILYMEQI